MKNPLIARQILIDPADWNALNDLAKQQQKTRPELIRHSVKEFIKKAAIPPMSNKKI